MSSQSETESARIKRAAALRESLCRFITTGALKPEHHRYQRLFLQLSQAADGNDDPGVLDWFLFDWVDGNGESVIDHFMDSRQDLSLTEQEILLDWKDSLNGVFEICLAENDSIALCDIETGDAFVVVAKDLGSGSQLKQGKFVATRLLPLGDRFIMSGPRHVIDDREAAREALAISRSLETLKSPESLEQAQKELCSAFSELFGCAELALPTALLHSTLDRLFRYVFFERREHRIDSALAQKFYPAFGRVFRGFDVQPEVEAPAYAGEVTILCDEFDGLVLLPNYNRFRSIFEARDPDGEVPGWRDLLWKYIRDPEIPMVAFERIAEERPDELEGVLRTVLEDDSFSIEHLYAMLLHYKQPIKGLNLEDDERLWDLLNGSHSDHSQGRTETRPRKRPPSRNTT